MQREVGGSAHRAQTSKGVVLFLLGRGEEGVGRLEPGAQGDLGEFIKYVERFGDLTLKCSEGLSHSSVLTNPEPLREYLYACVVS